MTGRRRWLVAAVASGALHAGVFGAAWMSARVEPALPPTTAAPAPSPVRAPVQVSLLGGSRQPPRAAGAAASSEPASAPARPAPKSMRPAHPKREFAAADANVQRDSSALRGPAPELEPEPEEDGEGEAGEASGAEGGTAVGEGTGASAGTGTGTGSREGATSAPPAPDLTRLTEALRRSAQRCYPSAAARYRLTGSASISFCVDASGGYSAVQLVRSSGHSLLDRAAVGCVVQGAVPLQAPPSCFTLPVEFAPAPRS